MAKWKKVVGVNKDPMRTYKTSFSKREAQRRWRQKNRLESVIRVRKSMEKKIGRPIKHSTEYWTERRLLSLVRQGIIIPEYEET
jgi:hypothetical protein